MSNRHNRRARHRRHKARSFRPYKQSLLCPGKHWHKSKLRHVDPSTLYEVRTASEVQHLLLDDPRRYGRSAPPWRRYALMQQQLDWAYPGIRQDIADLARRLEDERDKDMMTLAQMMLSALR